MSSDFFFPWNYGFYFSSFFSTQNSPLVFLSPLNTMIHITNCIRFIMLKKFPLEMCGRSLPITGASGHLRTAAPSAWDFFHDPLSLHISFISLSCCPPLLRKQKQETKSHIPVTFPPPFSIHNIFIDFPVMTNFFCGWLCNTETKMNTHAYFTTFHISVCIFYNSSSVKFFFCLHFKVIIDSFKILWSCKDKSVTCRSLVSSMWLHLRWMRREIKPRKLTLAHCSSLNCSVLVFFYPSLLYVCESVGL